jgi:hypothetical protein
MNNIAVSTFTAAASPLARRLTSRLTARRSLFTIALAVKFDRPLESRLPPVVLRRTLRAAIRGVSISTFASPIALVPLSPLHKITPCLIVFGPLQSLPAHAFVLMARKRLKTGAPAHSIGGMDFGFRPNGFPGLTPLPLPKSIGYCMPI